MAVEEIITLILAQIPSIVAFISMIVMIVKVVRQFTALRDAVKNDAELNKVKDQLQVVIQENYELKKQIQELISKIDKIDPPTTTPQGGI